MPAVAVQVANRHRPGASERRVDPRRLPGALQLHEVRPADAAGYNGVNGIDFNNLTEQQHFGDIYEQILNDLQSAGNAGEYYTPRAVTAFMVQQIDPHPGETLFDPACGTGGFLTCAIRHMREHYAKKTTDEWQLQNGLRAVEKKQAPAHAVRDEHASARHRGSELRPARQHAGASLHLLGPVGRVDIVLTNPPFGGREEDGIESNFPQHFPTRDTADLFLALIIRVLKPGGRAAVVLPDGSLFGEGVKTRAEAEVAAIRDQLKGILSEALAR